MHILCLIKGISTKPQWIALGLVLVSLGFRLGLALSHQGMWGVDGGAYFLSRNAALGNEPTGILYIRPLLAPGWLLVPFTSLLGDDIGYKVFSAFGSLAIAFPFWLLARRFLSPWQSVAALTFLLIDLELAEMLVTVIMPIIGLSNLTLVLWAMVTLAEKPHRWAFLGLLLAMPLIAHTSQTTTGIAAIMLPVTWLALWRFLGVGAAKRVAIPLLGGGILAASALPWYGGVNFGSEMIRYPGALLYSYPFRLTDVWLQVVLGASVGLWIVLRTQRPTLRVLASSLLALTILSPFLSHDEALLNIFYRSRYFLAVPLYIGLAWFVFYKWLPRCPKPLAASFATAALLLVSAGWLYQVQNQASISNLMTTDSVAAMRFLKPLNEDKTIITNSEGLAWWIAGLTRTKAVWPISMPPPRAWEQQHQDVLCVFGWTECEVAASAKRLGAKYVLIDEKLRWSGQVKPIIWGAPENPWGTMRARASWLQSIWSQGSVTIWEIAGKGG